MQLLGSHGHAEASLRFASVCEDSPAKFERVVGHHAAAGHWLKVLDVLDRAPMEQVRGWHHAWPGGCRKLRGPWCRRGMKYWPR